MVRPPSPGPMTMHTTLRRVALLPFAFALVALVPAYGDDRGATPVRARMQAFVDQGEIAGAVTVVGRKDAVLSHEAVGFQDLENRTSMAKNALFRIASMTKPVTAIGVMILANEGKLKVEDPV